MEEPGGSAAAATLPASTVAAYSPRDSRVLGACVLNGSSQYASTSSPPVTKIGVGGSTFVVGCRLNIVSGSTNRAGFAFGDSSTTANYSMLYVTNLEALYLHRDEAASGDATEVLAAGQSGKVSCAVRFGDDGKVRIAVLAPGATEVTWIDDTSVRSFTVDRFSIGALVRSSVSSFFDSHVSDAYVGTSAAAITDAAMEQFCKGASPANVGAANHWPGRLDWDDAIGSTDLSETGGPLAFTGTDVVVIPDLTGDPSHANYQADVVGGASFGGSNFMQNVGGYTPPTGQFVLSMFVTLPDVTPSSTVTLWSSDDQSAAEVRALLLSTTGTLIARETTSSSSVGDASLATAFSAAGVPHFVALVYDPTESTGRSLYVAPVGGALSSNTNATTGSPTGIDTIRFGQRFGSAIDPESGTVITDAKITAVSELPGTLAEFLRSRLRNWKHSQPATHAHHWPFTSNANDTGSGTATNLTWAGTGSAAYSDSLVVSSHQNLMAAGGVTYADGEVDLDGSSGYLRVMNAHAVETPTVVTTRLVADIVTGAEHYWSASNSSDADNERLWLRRFTTTLGAGVVDGGSSSVAAATVALAAGVATTAQGAFISGTSRTITIDGAGLDEDTTALTPSGIDQEVWGRDEDATPDSHWEGSFVRWLKHTDPSENESARTWAEEAAA